METIEFAGIGAIAVVMVMVMYQAVTTALAYRMIQEAEPKVKLRKKGTLHRYLWVCISLAGIIANGTGIGPALENGDISSASGHLYFCSAWSLMMLLWLFTAIFCRFSYISPERILSLTGSRRSLRSENVSYSLSGSILEIYSGKSSFAKKYEIRESTEKLVQVLEKNYRKRASE